MDFFPAYCNCNRDLAQIANAFIKQFHPYPDVVEDLSIYENIWKNGEYDDFLEAAAAYIHTKEKDFGEPGYEPDLVYYLDEYVQEDPEHRGWWTDEWHDDPICEFLYQAPFAWNEAVEKVFREEIDSEDYVYENYGLDAGDCDWPYNDLDYCIDSALENGNGHGFQNRFDLKYVLEECIDRDKLHESVYYGGGMGYHCIDGEDYCETGSHFLGNGEEHLDFDWLGLEMPFDFTKLPIKYSECMNGQIMKQNFSIMNDECYVNDDFDYGCRSLYYIIFFSYDWEDVIEAALENGFEMDEEKNIIRKEVLYEKSNS